MLARSLASLSALAPLGVALRSLAPVLTRTVAQVGVPACRHSCRDLRTCAPRRRPGWGAADSVEEAGMPTIRGLQGSHSQAGASRRCCRNRPPPCASSPWPLAPPSLYRWRVRPLQPNLSTACRSGRLARFPAAAPAAGAPANCPRAWQCRAFGRPSHAAYPASLHHCRA